MFRSQSLSILSQDGRLLFYTRTIRLFAYGFLSVILIIYLTQIGLSKTQIGFLLTSTLLGDAVISLWMTTIADRVGRKRMLIVGSILMVVAGIIFALTNNIVLLILVATIGVISPGGNEVGPFLAIEQASLSHLVSDQMRTRVFAWYALVGATSTAIGALCTGFLVQVLTDHFQWTLLDSCRVVVFGYGAIGVVLFILFNRLSSEVEILKDRSTKINIFAVFKDRFGLPHSAKTVLKLSMLFTLDSFAGGFILQSIVAYWFYIRFGVDPVVLGGIFFGINVLSGLSALVSARLSSKIGLIPTMVFTHIPANLLLILVPLMPNLSWAITIYLLRSTMAQMDVPVRQSYTMAVVTPEERSAAAGVTNIARTLGMSISPIFIGPLLGHAELLQIAFFVGGGLKIVYDLLLYKNFRHITKAN